MYLFTCLPVYLFAAELVLEVFGRRLCEINKRIMRLYVPVYLFVYRGTRSVSFWPTPV